MDQVARIEQELDGFQDTLRLYREQLQGFLNRSTNTVSHALDMPSLMGMERQIKLGDITTSVSSDDDNFFSSVAQCPKSGILLIESKFESVHDIPLGNIQVDVIAVDGGESTRVLLDQHGKGQFKGTPGKFYRLHVQSEVTPEQVNALFSSYDALTDQLQAWLRSEWQGFKPQWSQSAFAATGNGLLAGSWAAITGVWDRIELLSDMLQDPGQFADRLGSGAAQLTELAKTAPQAMEKVQLLASDEAVLSLLM
ncbi:type IV secretion protein Rhs, partial [Pseudomonas sp. 14P_8.1_Bac3]|nr:type IV secretion protein Rhs [Pseudomonas sp. 14P_8.1_Bac3]